VARFNGAMLALTRRRSKHAPAEGWQMFYDDVQVGTIGIIRADVPNDVDQWGWSCGFHPLGRIDGTAAHFKIARSEFDAAWQESLPKCTEADLDNCRRKRAMDVLEICDA
jgi:hypothetical protein